jgi:ABC-type bacteriocin/lantibiotic exporter with double-glycine peptidase domain
MRLYYPQSGDIKLNNESLSSLSNLEWRGLVGYVDQEAFFFYGTILENLTFGSKVYSDQDIDQALKLSHCKEFVSSLTLGVDTVIGDKGNLLSGGQKSRLSFARAILLQPQLLILDEVTSGLDEVTTKSIVKSLLEIKKDMIVVCITHDDAIVEISDDLYKLESKTLIKLKGDEQ